MADKKGLGRGLDALLGGYEEPEKQQSAVMTVSVYDIDTNPDQPRKTFDDQKLNELAVSLKNHGVVQPLIVRKKGDRYLIVAGERRFRAARIAGLKQVPVVISEIDADAVAEIALIENIQREDLNPIEEAGAIRFLMKQHDLTQEELSERLGKSRPVIANALRLLTLPQALREMISTGVLSAGHGKMLAGISDAKQQQALAARCMDEGWSVRRLEEELRRLSETQQKKPRKARDKDPELTRVEREIKTHLAAKVQITGNGERGKIVISYYSREDLESIYQNLMRE